jgi:hypothetical protein
VTSLQVTLSAVRVDPAAKFYSLETQLQYSRNPFILNESNNNNNNNKQTASSMLHEAKIAYYAFDAAILCETTIGPAVAKAT